MCRGMYRDSCYRAMWRGMRRDKGGGRGRDMSRGKFLTSEAGAIGIVWLD